jgi:hypothetical protein
MKKIIILSLIVSSISIQSCKKKGCTNPNASNYNSTAKKDDGSCILKTPGLPSGSVLSDINNPTTLVNTSADIDYYINSEVTVSAALTIEAGVKIICSNSGGLYINGNNASLKCNGTAASPVIFKSANGIAGSWKGIWFEGSNNVNNNLTYTHIFDGGSGSFNGNNTKLGNVQAYGSCQLRINHSLFSNSASAGFRTDRFADLNFAQFSTNSFTNNATSPMVILDNMVHQLDGVATTFSGNGNNYIEINAASFEGLGGDRVWKKQNIPYAFFNTGDDLICGYYTTNGSLTLEAGVDLRMGPGSRIVVGDNENITGFFKCLGTAAEPVNISGVSQIAGAWLGILISTTSNQNNWTYTNISHGGSDFLSGSATNRCNVLVGRSSSDNATLTISNCESSFSQYCGYSYDNSGAGTNTINGFFGGTGNGTGLYCP